MTYALTYCDSVVEIMNDIGMANCERKSFTRSVYKKPDLTGPGRRFTSLTTLCVESMQAIDVLSCIIWK